MRNAIIYTGEIRTMLHTIKGFKKNILQYENAEIFAVLQGDITQREFYSNVLKGEFGDRLQSLNWLDKDDDLYIRLKSKTLNNIPISQTDKHYLCNGGSIIEYYQLQTAYENIVRKELKDKFSYNYIIKCRTDTLFLQPIDFSWLNLSLSEIQSRINQIYKILKSKDNQKVNNKALITYFMSTIINSNLIENINGLMYSEEEFPAENQYLNLRDLYLHNVLTSNTVNLANNIREYIKNGMYIYTVRKNLLYIVKREFFGIIPCLGSFYGNLDFFKNSHWWNAECQFRSACAYSGLSIYHYDTQHEDKCLYNHSPDDYKNKNSLYFLMRNKDLVPDVVKELCNL